MKMRLVCRSPVIHYRIDKIRRNVDDLLSHIMLEIHRSTKNLMLGLLSKRYYANGEACFKFKNAAYVLSSACNCYML